MTEKFTLYDDSKYENHATNELPLASKNMSKKEEKAKEYIPIAFEKQYNSHLDSDDIRMAFEAGWDSSIENVECIAKWNDAKRTLPEFNEDNNAVICIADDNYVSLQRGKLADKTKLWCWLSDILPVAIL